MSSHHPRHVIGGGTAGSSNRVRIKVFNSPYDEKFINQIWEQLKKAIQEIQNKNNSGLSFEELYRNAYTLVLQKKGDILYYGTQEAIVKHMEKIRDEMVRHLNSSFLNVLKLHWLDHEETMKMIGDILMYMDRVFIETINEKPVYIMGLNAFKDHVIMYGPIHNYLQQTLLKLIYLERQGEVISRTQMRDCTKMLVHLGVEHSNDVYEKEFENIFLQQTSEYYCSEADRFLIENNSAILYIRMVQKRIEEEEKRADSYLDPQTKPKLVLVLANELIKKNMLRIVDMESSGLTHMLNNDRFDYILDMYETFRRCADGLKIMSDVVSQYLRSRGQTIVSDSVSGALSPVAYVQEMLIMKVKTEVLLTKSLNNERIFRNQINNDFEYFLNLDSQSPEYLALFIDDKLKRSNKNSMDKEVDGILDRCVVLFRFLQEKDTFERYYKIQLAKRLLSPKNQCEDFEKSMIQKLRTECGCDFTSRLEGMFKDIQVSETLMSEYNKHHVEASSKFQSSNIDISVSVLTTGYWPFNSANNMVNLPRCALETFEFFKKFYLNRHVGRKLTLQPYLGTAEMTCTFYEDGMASSSSSRAPPPAKIKRYFITMTTYQMVVMCLFNGKSEYTFGQLQSLTQIPHNELIRAIQALACAKASQRLLLKEPKNPKEFNETDMISLNEKFQSKHVKIKVQNVNVKESEPEKQETRSRIDENRNYVIEATIVRIMKARRRMDHSNLIAEVTSQLKDRFQPTPQQIKARIETLLDREFLARVAEDRRVYIYRA